MYIKNIILFSILLLPLYASANVYSVNDNSEIKDVSTIKITFTGYITQKKATAFISVLDEINQKYINAKKIIVYLNSDGGDIDASTSMFYAVRGSKTKITTSNLSIVASAATIPYCAGENREVMKEAKFIIHPAQLDSIEEKNITPSKITTSQIYINSYNHIFSEIYSECTNLKQEELKKILSSDDNRLYLYADDSIKHHLATKIEQHTSYAPVSYFITDD